MKTVATSSMVAELMAINDLTRQCVWQLKILKEIGLPQDSIEVQTDSQCVIKWVQHARPTGKAKHINIAYFWTAEVLHEGQTDQAEVRAYPGQRSGRAHEATT